MMLSRKAVSRFVLLCVAMAIPLTSIADQDREAASAAVSNTIRQAYLTELGREPDAGGMETFYSLMTEDPARDATWLRRELRHSKEARQIRARQNRIRLNTLYVVVLLVAALMIVLAIPKTIGMLCRKRRAGSGAKARLTVGAASRVLFRGIRWALLNVVIAAALILILEGIASFTHVFNRPPEKRTPQGHVAERMHTEYDNLLGWAHIPNTVISNMYGKGRHLRINGQGFRDDHDIASNPPSDTIRVIASGDSFTMGYGVGNDAVWVQQLENMVDGIECVNMGQGGYGLGQAYLWYKRDGEPLPHDIHILSFITDDYRRMTVDRFMGYGKPVLTVDDRRQVQVHNTPPPRHRLGEEPWRVFFSSLTQLRLFSWLKPAVERRRKALAEQWRGKARETARALFTDLYAMHQQAGRTGILVHLPWEDDYDDDESDLWREWLSREAEANGWIFIDLVEPFRTWPEGEIESLFIQDDAGRFRGARGHYTEKGNRKIAAALLAALKNHPDITL